jgi:hypothetical protein
VEETARPVASPGADVVAGRHDGHPAVGWSLAGAGPVDVVVIGILAVGVAEVPASMRRMRSMGLAPGAGDPSLADRSARGTWAGAVMIRMPASVKTASDVPVITRRYKTVRDHERLPAATRSASAGR